MTQPVLNLTKLAQQTAEVDGAPVHYTSDTQFLVQLGRGAKGSFRTKFSTVGNLGQALLFYQGLNIGVGYKKRLLKVTKPKPQVLARSYS